MIKRKDGERGCAGLSGQLDKVVEGDIGQLKKRVIKETQNSKSHLVMRPHPEKLLEDWNKQCQKAWEMRKRGKS